MAKKVVYGHSGGFCSGATIEESYRNFVNKNK
jgi:hypothetical protein